MKKGFSLIELSIVLIIIGLIIGGLTVGSSLIRSSKIQAVVSDFGKYRGAAISYKEKYHYWPGDNPDAQNIWSAAAGFGDGNGTIDGASGGKIGSTEVFYAPQELALAGFIQGSYTGTGTVVAGVNFPRSPLDGATNLSLAAPIYVYVDTDLGGLNVNVLAITDISGSTMLGGIKPNQAQAIDEKIDDGIAGNGSVRGFNSADGATTMCLASGQYDIGSNNTDKCIVTYTLE